MFNAVGITKKTDEELAKLSLSDSAFLGILLGRYESRLLAYIRRLGVRKPEDAEDVLQEAFIKIYRNLADFDSAMKFSSWAYRIARNESVSRFRRERARPARLFSDVGLDTIEQVADNLNLEKEVDARLRGEKVRAALRSLPMKYQEALELYCVEQKSYEEISDILRKPVGTVGTLIKRAKKLLRAGLNNLI